MKQDFPRPQLFVSRCLGFEACRYNGLKIQDHTVEALKSHCDIITACPEVSIGLGIPRDPIRVVEESQRRILFQPSTGACFTGEMEAWIEAYLDTLDTPDGFVLKAKSPSCGPWGVKLYKGKENPASSGTTHGFFGGEVLRRFPHSAVEEEGRLRNFTLREHFFTRLYLNAAFREQLGGSTATAADLVRFHTVHKLLFLAYNQAAMRRLGKIVARAGLERIEDLVRDYRRELTGMFAKPPKFTSMINAFEHAFGGLSDGMESDERKFFIRSLEEYRDERIPASTIIRLLEGWAIRFSNEYLLEQSLLRPFPRELSEISDSGKGRNY